jgi:hypothetical protein
MNLVRADINLDQLNDIALTIRSAKFGMDASSPTVGKIDDIAIEICDLLTCGIPFSRFNKMAFLNTCGIK